MKLIKQFLFIAMVSVITLNAKAEFSAMGSISLAYENMEKGIEPAENATQILRTILLFEKPDGTGSYGTRKADKYDHEVGAMQFMAGVLSESTGTIWFDSKESSEDPFKAIVEIIKEAINSDHYKNPDKKKHIDIAVAIMFTEPLIHGEQLKGVSKLKQSLKDLNLENLVNKYKDYARSLLLDDPNDRVKGDNYNSKGKQFFEDMKKAMYFRSDTIDIYSVYSSENSWITEHRYVQPFAKNILATNKYKIIINNLYLHRDDDSLNTLKFIKDLGIKKAEKAYLSSYGNKPIDAFLQLFPNNLTNLEIEISSDTELDLTKFKTLQSLEISNFDLAQIKQLKLSSKVIRKLSLGTDVGGINFSEDFEVELPESLDNNHNSFEFKLIFDTDTPKETQDKIKSMFTNFLNKYRSSGKSVNDSFEVASKDDLESDDDNLFGSDDGWFPSDSDDDW